MFLFFAEKHLIIILLFLYVKLNLGYKLEVETGEERMERKDIFFDRNRNLSSMKSGTELSPIPEEGLGML